MPIDSSLYSQLKSPDILGSFNQGLELADRMKERRARDADAEKKQVLQSAYNAGLTQNPDGSVGYDESKTLKFLADNGLGQEYLAGKKQFGDMAAEQFKQKAEMDKAKLDYTGQAIGAAKANPQAWPQIRQDYIAKTGADPATIPEAYDPKFIAQTESSLLTAAQRQAQGNEDRNFGLKEKELALKAREAANKKTSDSGNLAESLRKERNQLPTTKSTQEVSAAYNKIKSAAKNVSAAGDLSLIFAYMKMLDPSSTVREGEYANASNAGGVDDKAISAYNRAINGQTLSDSQRRDFVGQARGVYESQLNQQKKIDADFERLAKSKGIDPKDVIINFEADQEPPTPEEIAAEIQRRNLKNAANPQGGTGG